MCRFCEKTFKVPPLVRDACPELLIGINNIDFIKDFFYTKQRNRHAKFNRKERIMAKKIYFKLIRCGLTIRAVDEEGHLQFAYIPATRLPNGGWEEEFNLCRDRPDENKEKPDPDYKKKIHLLMLRTDHKISQDELENKMAEFYTTSSDLKEIPF